MPLSLALHCALHIIVMAWSFYIETLLSYISTRSCGSHHLLHHYSIIKLSEDHSIGATRTVLQQNRSTTSTILHTLVCEHLWMVQ